MDAAANVPDAAAHSADAPAQISNAAAHLPAVGMDAAAHLPATGLFVTGTDTGVGKTVLSAALLAVIAAAGVRVRAYKPIVTGLDEAAADGRAAAWPLDHELLGRICRMAPEEVSPLSYGPAVSPHLAAALAGERIDGNVILAAARDAAAGARRAEAALVVEGVGGLLVPLTDDLSVRDLAVELRLPLLIAARPGLGTISHTLLTIEAARAHALDVRAVVLTPWPQSPSAMELSNRETIARLGQVEVEVLASACSAATSELAKVGEALPWRRWLS